MKYFIILVIFYSSSIFAQFNGKKFSVGVNAVYTTGAKIYFNPYSSDPILRNNSFSVGGILNPAIDFKYRFSEQILFGLSTEYMSKTSVGYNITVLDGNRTYDLPVNDGFKLIPIEVSIYYFLPFSTERFKFLMGAGAGYYLGERIRNFGNEKIENVERKFAYGIQVSVSMDYALFENISLHYEMKFRDPQFIVKSRYLNSQVEYNGKTYDVVQDTFDSKVNVDGVTFILGAAFMF